MGCDIHVAIETRRRGDRLWRRFCIVKDLGRSYQFFAELADVRGVSQYMPIAANRGTPPDAEWWVPHDLGEHSFTWCWPTEWATALRRSRFVERFEHSRWERFSIWLENIFQLEVTRRDCSFSRVLEVCRTLERTREVRLLIGFDS